MRKWYPATLVVLSLVISIIAFGHLPDPMPIHWDLQGRVNGYGSRWVGAFLDPLVMIAVAVMIPVLPRVRPNWMMGIRTPWTLSSDRVWERTHRVGGYLMTGLGVLLVLAAALAPAAATLILIVVGVVIVSFGTIIYSYLAWREEKRA